MIDLLLGNLGLVIDADGDGKRIRDAILQLAVRGRLVAQEAGDGGWESLTIGEMLLARLASVTPAESPSEIFELWSVPAFADGEPEILRGSEIRSSKKVVSDGVTLLAKINPHLKRVWTVRRRSEHRLLASPEWIPLQSDRAVARYLEIALNSEDFVVPFKATAQGMGSLTRASIKSAKTLPIPVPPLAEQHRIVAKVDELMGHAAVVEDRHLAASSARVRFRDAALHALAEAEDHEAVAEAWSRIEDHFDDLFTEPEDIQPLRQTILQLAVRGRLVAQEAGDEGGLRMLQDGVELPAGARRRKKIWSKSRLDVEGVVFPDLPPSWIYCTVEEAYKSNLIVDFADGNHGSLYPRKTEFSDAGVKFVTATQLRNGRLIIGDAPHLSDQKASELTKGWAKGGDVLLAHNATVGPVAHVEEEVGEFLLGTSVTFYRLHPNGIVSRYFAFCLMSSVWQDQMGRVMKQTTRNQVSIQKQAQFRFPLPPLAEQHRIVAKVDEIMVLCDTLETSLERAKTTREQFATSISHALTTPEPVPA